jgi:hypothetical protein
MPLPDGDEFRAEAKSDDGDVQFAFAHGNESSSGNNGAIVTGRAAVCHEELRRTA